MRPIVNVSARRRPKNNSVSRMLSLSVLIAAAAVQSCSSFHAATVRPHAGGRIGFVYGSRDVYRNDPVSSLHLQQCDEDDGAEQGCVDRKRMISTTLSGLLSVPLFRSEPAQAVTRAVGSAERKCREAGNCLEKGDWDGAVGWQWGGKDRCDATDPRCGADGILLDAPRSGDPVPPHDNLAFTHVAEIDVAVGRGEQGRLSLGLYGDACPAAVQQIVDFLDRGLVTGSRLALEDGYGQTCSPVTLSSSGALNVLYPNERLDFGVSSQQIAYAKKNGLVKAPDDFVPQPRPTKSLPQLTTEPSARPHDRAGLLSVPAKGLGYGGSGLEPDDEAFASAFQLTASAVPSLDKSNRKVIGQLTDVASMALLARLASLTPKKGLKGVLPGQNYGPPLLKVTVLGVSVRPVVVAAPPPVEDSPPVPTSN